MHLHVKEVAEIKKGCDHLSVFYKDLGIKHDICQKNSATAGFEPKNYIKNAYFEILANLQQKCINGLNWN